MRGKYRPHHILEVVLLFIALAGFSESNSKANENSKYLDAVREFADNVLKDGKDVYGPKHTPLFVDGLNIHTHEPVKWIAPSGEKWVLSNLASQQNLFRTLDGLTKITDDPKYRQAAVEAIEYAFANLRSPNGLLYWGVGIAYDAQAEKQCGIEIHSLKCHCPYYELMWEVDPRATRKFIEAYWSAHILDWSNLDMNRGAPLNKPLGETWSHEYKGGPVFFESSGRSMLVAGTDLFWAAGFLGKVSGDREPLVWAKRLIHRYVETRNPGVGLSGAKYTHGKYDGAKHQLGEDFKGHLVLTGTLFPSHPEMGNTAASESFPAFLFVTPGISHSPAIAPWISAMLLGDMLDADGREFNRWALEELTSLGKIAYRKNDNSFIPMLIDGTSLEGYVCKKDGAYGSKGTAFEPIQAVPMDFWAYALAYRLTGDQFMWHMARSIASGHGLGDIGVTPETQHQLKTATDCWSPYTLLGFIELYRKTGNQVFLKIARKIGDNLLARRFHKGFFVPSDKHTYTKFDTIEHLVLLQLHAALRQTFSCVPEVWPGRSLFNSPYRDREYASDYSVIYALTESPYPPKLLEEAVVSGDVEGVRLLISQGADVNARSEGNYRTPLHWAAMEGHRDIVELLLAHDAGVNTGRITALHYAAKKGHKEIAELLIANGADVNAKNREGQTPVDVAVVRNRSDLVKLLIEKGADISLHTAARLGDLAIVKSLIEEMADINAKDTSGQTSLHYAAEYGRKDIAELLIANGANVNAKDKDGNTPGHVALGKNNRSTLELLIAKGANFTSIHLSAYQGDLDEVRSFIDKGVDVNAKNKSGETPLHKAAIRGHKDVVELLIDNAANINATEQRNYTPVHYAVWSWNTETAELIIEKGADVQAKDRWGWTPLHYAASGDNRGMAELLIAKGADVNAKDSSGETALSVAKEKGHTEIVELLRKHGAKKNKAPESAPK